MISWNVIIDFNESKGGEFMDAAAREDVRETALKLNEVYRASPENYNYIKGFIHCLLLKSNRQEAVIQQRQMNGKKF